jgi:hypothetical protein
MRIGKGRSSSTTRLTVELRLNRIATKRGPTGLPHPIRRMPHMPPQRRGPSGMGYRLEVDMATRRGMFLQVTLLESASPRSQLKEADGDIWTWEGLGTSSRQRKGELAAGQEPCGPKDDRAPSSLKAQAPKGTAPLEIKRAHGGWRRSPSIACDPHRLIWPPSRCAGGRWPDRRGTERRGGIVVLDRG